MMKRRWYTGLLVVGFALALGGCNRESSGADTVNPLQFNEVPVEAPTFDWSLVAADPSTLAQGLDNYPSEVASWSTEAMNLEAGSALPPFDFEEVDTQYQSVESDPNEIPLESGIPLETTNNDPNLGSENQLPGAQENMGTEGGDSIDNGEEPIESPTPEPTSQPITEPIDSGNSESLPKTADVPLIVFSLMGLVMLATLIVVLKKPSQASEYKVNH